MSVTNHGTIESFDRHRGLGYIAFVDEKVIFHCVEIVDGSRDIAVDTPVSFIMVTRFDVREASQIKSR